MKIDELDTNRANHRKQVSKILSANGYKKLGSGVDAMAFGKSDSPTIVKIVIPAEGDLDKSKNTFTAWMDYCKKNAKNPHLPKFIKLKMQPIVIDGEKFELQGMEKLKRLNDREHNMCLNMVRGLDSKMKFQKFIKDYYSEQMAYYKEVSAHPNLIKELLAEQKLASTQQALYETLANVEKVGKGLGFTIDFFQSIDTSNLMKRTDNTIVIADPWVD